MTREREDYELAENVTSAATSKGRRDTAVLSVRLPSSEISALEAASATCGKTTAQLVREAISMHLANLGLFTNQPSITVTWGDEGRTVSTGPSRPENRASQTETRVWPPMTVGALT